jgi:AraC-like DNA-binding protein
MQDRPIFERTEDRQWTGSLPIAYYYLHKLSSSDMIITPNWHNEMEFLYTEATLTLYIDDKSYEMAPGDIAFINPRQIHRAVRNGPGEVYAFVFDLTSLKISDDNDRSNRLIDEVIHQKKQFITKPKRDSHLYQKTKELFSVVMAYGSDPVGCGAEAYEFLSCLYGIMAVCLKSPCVEERGANSREKLRYVMEMMDYINDHYQESLTAEYLAKQINLSPTYLYALFRDYIGITPVNYINSIRLREAYRLLEQGMSVTQTATAVGIPNVSYFIKLFKSATGQTPLQWNGNKN